MKRVAVIGTGQFGQNHARVYAETEKVELVAICDINQNIGQTVVQKYNVPFVTDFREVIGKVDAVSLATPTISHHEITCELLNAGIAVLVEKPIAVTLAEADEMIATARRNNTVLQIGHLERFNPAVIAATRIATTPR